MQIPYAKHLEASVTLLGRNRLEASAFLESLRSRPLSHTFYGDCRDTVVLVTEGAGSVATFMTSPPSEDNKEKLILLLQNALKNTAQKGIATAHALLGEDDLFLAHLFKVAAFTELATLCYMEWRAHANQSDIAQTTNANFCAISACTDNDFEKILKETYIGSLDCPAIHGKRDIKDIIQSHQGFGANDLSLWFTILLDQEPAGVLLLNKPKNEQYFELAYLGISPRMRKKGLAEEAMDYAINQATRRGCNKIILAVDASNTPAIRLYKKAHFRETVKRIAMFCPLR
jgi:ribosomal protein S18 acetylase RimI-like enzyme